MILIFDTQLVCTLSCFLNKLPSPSTTGHPGLQRGFHLTEQEGGDAMGHHPPQLPVQDLQQLGQVRQLSYF